MSKRIAKTRVLSKRAVKIQERKLGKDKALGMCWYDTGEIEIDPRQDSREYLDTLIHEMLHCFFPDMSEKDVAKVSAKMSNAIWQYNYRRVAK